MDIEKIKAQMDEIPFGNSDFQERNFTAGEESPSRRLRTVCINFDARYKAMKEAEFKTREILLDLDEKREQLVDLKSERDIQRKMIEIERLEFNMKEQEKLIKDAAISMQRYYDEFESLPKMDRTEFEEAEHKYWFKRLSNQLELGLKGNGTLDIGVLDSMRQIGFNVNRGISNQLIYTPINDKAVQLIENIKTEMNLLEANNGSDTNG